MESAVIRCHVGVISKRPLVQSTDVFFRDIFTFLVLSAMTRKVVASHPQSPGKAFCFCAQCGVRSGPHSFSKGPMLVWVLPKIHFQTFLSVIDVRGLTWHLRYVQLYGFLIHVIYCFFSFFLQGYPDRLNLFRSHDASFQYR